MKQLEFGILLFIFIIIHSYYITIILSIKITLSPYNKGFKSIENLFLLIN